MSNFRGIWVALPTPFRSRHVDFDTLEGLVKSLLSGGVRGLVVCGTTGEAAAMSKKAFNDGDPRFSEYMYAIENLTFMNHLAPEMS